MMNGEWCVRCTRSWWDGETQELVCLIGEYEGICGDWARYPGAPEREEDRARRDEAISVAESGDRP